MKRINKNFHNFNLKNYKNQIYKIDSEGKTVPQGSLWKSEFDRKMSK